MTGRLVLAGALTVLPILLLVGCFARRNARRKPPLALAGTFFFGVLSALPAMAVVVLASLASISSPWAAAAIGAFAVTAIPEELLKLLVIRGYSARRPGLLRRADGLVYGITAALGFGVLENALYVLQGGWWTAALRAATAVPMNASTGALLGYGIAIARLAPDRRKSLAPYAIAAVLIHGIYDFALIATALSPRMGAAADTGRIVFPIIAFAALLAAVGWVVDTTLRLRRTALVAPFPTESPRDS
ncbi:MAG: PrsW family glutamic-type intramembrane protease [Candidatus Bipolaricaulis sp.]|nr:PrsW family glutamic-type intramembrane protease [Candidatus Bipolaricaulis sp.]